MTPQDLELSRRFFSPNGFWLWNYIIDPSVRYIVLFGGSSSGKSFAVAQLFTLFNIFFFYFNIFFIITKSSY